MRRNSFADKVFAGLAALTALALVGCGGGGDDSPTPPISTSTVRVELTDAPGDLAAAWVDIAQIVLVGTGGETLLRDASLGDLYDLTELDGETVEIADKGGIVPGTYGQLRLVIDQAEIETASGEVYTRNGGRPGGPEPTGELACDTCDVAFRGIPAFIGGDGVVLEGDETVTLVLDFDAFRSFERTAEGWSMTPVASAAVKSRTTTVSGSVSIGELSPVPASCGGKSTLESFVPLLVDADNPRASWAGRVGPDGTYEIDFVPEGSYDVTHVPSVEFENETLNVSASSSVTTNLVQIEAGQDVTIDFSIGDGSCVSSGES